uniref:Uncharacterized protein n=1 Tax=Steinernema glaseri TaxID=37863 RepID=A0A1I8AUJ0_9BILA
MMRRYLLNEMLNWTPEGHSRRYIERMEREWSASASPIRTHMMPIDFIFLSSDVVVWSPFVVDVSAPFTLLLVECSGLPSVGVLCTPQTVRGSGLIAHVFNGFCAVKEGPSAFEIHR